MKKAKLTLGPLFYHWPAEKRRDFYFQIADESDFDVVYLGEVVCSKRESFFEPHLQSVIDRLRNAGKEIVFSTLALITTKNEMESVRAFADCDCLVEANDVAALQALQGKPFVVGPFINVFNEGSLDFVRGQGAVRVVFPVEMTEVAMGSLAAGAKGFETEVQVFGRQPLSVSMRCYHARANGANKDSCRFACGGDPEGLPIETIDGESFLTVNGTQLLSRGYVVLFDEMKKLQAQGVTHFRLAPQSLDMVRIAALYRAVFKGEIEAESACANLREITGNVPFVNGFQHAREGLSWVEKGGESA
jgi:collagenase-like PrtC family protease